MGTWVTEATHPALPRVVVRGTTVVEWLDGSRFLSLRSRNEHPDFPDALSIIGFTDVDRVGEDADGSPATSESELFMHYFDSRGVFRVYRVSMDDGAWRIWRDAPGFSQRFTGTFAEGGDEILGRWKVSKDGARWDDDLEITYRRRDGKGRG